MFLKVSTDPLIYPEGTLSDVEIENIKSLCFGYKLPMHQNIAFQYLAKFTNIQDSVNPHNYCYISFKQLTNIPKTKTASKNPETVQQAFILISHYPIPYLAYRVLSILESTHMTKMVRLESRSSHTPASPQLHHSELLNLFVQAFQQNVSWPSLNFSQLTDGNFGIDVMLPFFEQVISHYLSLIRIRICSTRCLYLQQLAGLTYDQSMPPQLLRGFLCSRNSLIK